MPSKLKKAIAAVKDQTSISLARVKSTNTNQASTNLEVTILKATTHDELPIEQRYIDEILNSVSSSPSAATICARALGRRITRTRTWVVAVKSLLIILRLFQDGDPHFPKEILHAMKRGYKILNLSGFRDDSSSSCPWDFTAFVRTFSLYLDDRLHLFLTGKLQRRRHHHNPEQPSSNHNQPVRDMKPSMLLDRISYWQRLLDRAIATRPTGAARSNRLIQISLYAVVQESFDLYRDISDGLALILDSFFHLGYASCVNAFHTCVKASKQFEELCSFYDLCKNVGVGRTSEYPSVQKISDELVETLQEFLKDQSSFPITTAAVNGGGPVSSHLLLPVASTTTTTMTIHPAARKEYSSTLSGRSDQSGSGGVDRDGSVVGEDGRGAGSVVSHSYSHSQCTSLEDLFSNADGGQASGISTPSHHDQERYSDPGDEKQEVGRFEDFFDVNDEVSVRSDHPIQHSATSTDLLSFIDIMSSLPETSEPATIEPPISDASGAGWELALIETATLQATTNDTTTSISTDNYNAGSGFTTETDFFNALSPQSTSSAAAVAGSHYNPFLDDLVISLSTPNPVANHSDSVTTIAGDSFNIPSNTGFLQETSFVGFSDNVGFPPVSASSTSTSNNAPAPAFPADDFFASLSNVNGDGNLIGPNNGAIDLFSQLTTSSTANGPAADLTDGGLSNTSQATGLSTLINGNNVSNSFNSQLDNGDATTSFNSDFSNANGFIPFNSEHSNMDATTSLSSDFSIDNQQHDQPSYSADFGPETFATPSNAIVPVSGVIENGGFLSFGRTPTFQATSEGRESSDEDDKLRGNSIDNDDPFGSFLNSKIVGNLQQHQPVQQNGVEMDQQSLLEQQELWLQNQNKIIAKRAQ